MIPFVRSICAFAALVHDPSTPVTFPAAAPTPSVAPIAPLAKPTDAELDAAVDALEEAFIASTEPGWVAAERRAAEVEESLARIMRHQIVRTRTDAEAELDAVLASVVFRRPLIGSRRAAPALEVRHLAAGDVLAVPDARGDGDHDEKVLDVLPGATAKEVLVLTDKGAFSATATMQVFVRTPAKVGGWDRWGRRKAPPSPNSGAKERALEAKPRAARALVPGDELLSLIFEQADDDTTTIRRAPRASARFGFAAPRGEEPLSDIVGDVLTVEDFAGEVTALGHLRPREDAEPAKVVGRPAWLASKQRAIA